LIGGWLLRHHHRQKELPMIHLSKLTPALAATAIGVLAMSPGAVAAPPSPQVLNPAPPDFYTCKALGAGAICTAVLHEVKVAEPQPELVCGSGPDAFVIHDNGAADSVFTRWYNADGNLTRRVEHEVWTDAFWSNPLSGKTVTYTQRGIITDRLTVPGDFDSTVETLVGENVYTDPITNQKVLHSVGRTVYGPDGLVSESGQQPFIDAFEHGDMSVFDPICAALS
jgi:hypothetical protein